MKKNLLKISGLIVISFVTMISSINSIKAFNMDITFDQKTELMRNAYETDIAQKVENYIQNTYGSYPSYYGGMYISNDSKNLVIQIVKENIPNQFNTEEYDIYSEMLNIDKSIIVEYVDNSYNELNDINDRIIEYFKSGNKYYNLKGNFVDVINNRVVVELFDVSKNRQIEFKKLIVDSDLITFVKFDKKDLIEESSVDSTISPKSITTLKPGMAIAGSRASCSMGFRAKVNNKEGFVTAAHCVLSLGWNEIYGTVTKWVYSANDGVDATFIEINSSYGLSNVLNYQSAINGIFSLNTNTYATLAVGTAVGKVGSTTGITFGQVTTLNYSDNYNSTVPGNSYFVKLIGTTLSVRRGDSGGAAFTTNLQNGGVTIAGVLKGTGTTGGSFSSAQRIYNSFGGYVRY